MGSPLTFSFLELPEDVIGAKRVEGLAGDIPDFYYTCGIPEALSEIMWFPSMSMAKHSISISASPG